MRSGLVATVRRRLLGLLLIAVVVAFFAVTVLFYNKAFTPVVSVSLKTDHAGNELLVGSDVKVRGLVVGTVRTVDSTGDGAVLGLALDPALVNEIPANVTAQLLPKSLFGERYVDLQIPADRSGVALASGDTIGQDRSSTGIEVEKVLNDLLPVLQAVQPQKLSVTLTAISTALQGRGPELGQTLAQLGQYVGDLNPQLPTLEHDLAALATTSDVYNAAAPHLLNALGSLTTTSQTLVDQQGNLRNLYATVSTASDNLGNFLAANENNLIQVSSASRPTLDTLARYSPEYPCFLKQLTALAPKVDAAFGKGTNQPGLHVTLEITVNRGKYVAGTDTPAYHENRGPRCYDLSPAPNPFPEYAPDGPINDGSSHPPAARSSNTGLLPSSGTQGLLGTTTTQSAVTSNLPNSAVEQGFLAELLAPSMGVDPAAVPSWSSVLVGPLFRGAEVTLK